LPTTKLHIFPKRYTQYSNHFLRFKISKGRYEGYYEGINFENCVKYITLVKQVVGNAWLFKELEKINSYKPPKKLRKLSFIDYTEKFHPLAFLIYQADKQLKTCLEKKFFEVS